MHIHNEHVQSLNSMTQHNENTNLMNHHGSQSSECQGYRMILKGQLRSFTDMILNVTIPTCMMLKNVAYSISHCCYCFNLLMTIFVQIDLQLL